MNRYEILLGKEPPKEDLIQAVQNRKSSARPLDPKEISNEGFQENLTMGVDFGSGDSTSVIRTIRTDSSSSSSFSSLASWLDNMNDPQTSIMTRREEAQVRFAPQAIVVNVQNDENLRVGDMVGTDASGVIQRITPDHLGVYPVGVVMEAPVPVSRRMWGGGGEDTAVIRSLTMNDQVNYNRIAEEHRAMTGALNARAHQAQSGATIARRYERQQQYEELLGNARLEEARRLNREAYIPSEEGRVGIGSSPPSRELYIHDGNYSAGVSGARGTPQPSHRGSLHEHPRMQQNLKIPNDHVIVDRNEWRRARQRRGNR